MLLSLNIDNFRSFNEGETFSLIANNKLERNSHQSHLVDLPSTNERGLKTAVLYGANGAGKSNIFKALLLLQQLVTRNLEAQSTSWKTFSLSTDPRPQGQIDLQIFTQGKIYNYGLILTSSRIVEEWLTTGTDDDYSVIFERTTNSIGSSEITLGDKVAHSSEKLKALVTLGVKPARTFLSTYQAFISKEEDTNLDIRAVIAWFRHKLTLVGPDSKFESLHSLVKDSSQFQTFLSSFLKGASTGVDKIEPMVRTLPIEDLSKYIPPSILSDFNSQDGAEVRIELPNGDEVQARTDQDTFTYSSLLSSHEVGSSKKVAFNITDESDGTQRLMHLMPTLFREENDDAVFFIDELDRSLHPNLCHKFMQTFLETAGQSNRQLIISTHESNLLDQDLFRRDEIWFVEKDAKKQSHLYSLVDFQPRKDLDLKKNYLRGRFGAIPFFSTLNTEEDTNVR